MDYTNLRITGGFGLMRLESLTVDIEANCHGRAHFSGVVEETSGFAALEESIQGKVVEIIQINGLGLRQETLFSGLAVNAAISQDGGYFHLEAELLSGTYLLDYQERSRSFQDVSMTYADVVNEVLKDTEHAHAIFSVGEDTPIGKPLLQYRETDWEFIKRLASHFETALIPEVSELKPRFWFGPRKGQESWVIDPERYDAVADGKFYRLGGSSQERRRRDFLYFDVETKDNLPLGDLTTFHNQPMKLVEKHAVLRDGTVFFTYRLAREEWTKVPKYYNEKIQGMSLTGTVLETRNELVKLHLDIDRDQDPAKAYEYDWVPDTGNFMYCMPQVGTRASLRFDSGDEWEARVVDCVRTNGQACPGMEDSSKRCFTTEHQKRMYLHPDKLGLVAFAGGDQIGMEDGSGVSVTSSADMAICAKGDINIQADQFVIQSPQTVALIQGGGAALTICNQFDIVGGDVNFFGEPGGGGAGGGSPKPPTKQWGGQAVNAVGTVPQAGNPQNVDPAQAAAVGAGSVAAASLGKKGAASSPGEAKKHVSGSAAASSVGIVTGGSGNAAGPVPGTKKGSEDASDLAEDAIYQSIGYGGIQQHFGDKYKMVQDNTYYEKPQIIPKELKKRRKYKICLPEDEVLWGSGTPTARDLRGYIVLGSEKISDWEFSWSKFITTLFEQNDWLPETGHVPDIEVRNHVKMANRLTILQFVLSLVKSGFIAAEKTNVKIYYLKNYEDDNDRVALIEFGPPNYAELLAKLADGKYHYLWSQNLWFFSKEDSEGVWDYFNRLARSDPSLRQRIIPPKPNSEKTCLDIRLRLDQKHQSNYPLYISFQSGKMIFAQKCFPSDRAAFVLIYETWLNLTKDDDAYDLFLSFEDQVFGHATFTQAYSDKVSKMLADGGVEFDDDSREYIWGPA